MSEFNFYLNISRCLLLFTTLLITLQGTQRKTNMIMFIFIKLHKGLNNTIQTVIKIQVEIPNLPETCICSNVHIT